MIDPHISSHKVDWLLMGLCALSASVTSQAFTLGLVDAKNLEQVMCFSFGGIGSVASGYLGGVLFPIKGMSFRKCWVMNFFCGFMLAPVATYVVIQHHPYLPIPSTAFAASFIFGAAGVKVLQYLLPVLLKLYERTIGISANANRPTDKKDDNG